MNMGDRVLLAGKLFEQSGTYFTTGKRVLIDLNGEINWFEILNKIFRTFWKKSKIETIVAGDNYYTFHYLEPLWSIQTLFGPLFGPPSTCLTTKSGFWTRHWVTERLSKQGSGIRSKCIQNQMETLHDKEIFVNI